MLSYLVEKKVNEVVHPGFISPHLSLLHILTKSLLYNKNINIKINDHITCLSNFDIIAKSKCIDFCCTIYSPNIHNRLAFKRDLIE